MRPGRHAGSVYAAAGDWATGGLWPAMVPALWNLRTGEVTKLAEAAGPQQEATRQGQGPGNAVNASGWVVAGGAVVRDGVAVDLAVPQGQSSIATEVSDTGLVVGQAITGSPGDDENHGPRVWRC